MEDKLKRFLSGFSAPTEDECGCGSDCEPININEEQKKDLKLFYENRHAELEKNVTNNLDNFVHFIKKFVEQYEEKKEIERKLLNFTGDE